MTNGALWQFFRENAGLSAWTLAGVVALCISFVLYRLHSARRRKQENQGLARCWLATLSELSTSLNDMRDTTRHLIQNRQRLQPQENVYKCDVSPHRWLREGFMVMAAESGQECRSLVNSLDKDLVLFNWNINQATNARLRGHGIIASNKQNRDKLQKLVDVFDNAAIRLACNRHNNMVDTWKKSVEMLNGFCLKNKLVRGNGLKSPGCIPLQWQMDESEPWMIRDLALVGEDNW